MIVDHAEMDIVAPVERVSPEIGVAEVCLPRVIIAPVEDLDVSIPTHMVVEANHLVVAVTQLDLFARVCMEVIDPFNSDADLHVDAHLMRLPDWQCPPRRHKSMRNRRFQFHKRRQLFIRAHHETLSLVAMYINNPDCSPARINS